MQKDSRRGAAEWTALWPAAIGIVLALGSVGCTSPVETPKAAIGTRDPAPRGAATSSSAELSVRLPGDSGDALSRSVEATRAVVVRVVDGDTAVFRLGGREEKTRFIGIDTPESTNRHEPFGAEASAYTERLLPKGRTVWLETDTDLRDRYGRLLAYVWLELPADDPDAEARAKMLNAVLAVQGYATQLTVPPNVRYAHVFTDCVAEAREARRGLWGMQP